MRLVAFGQQAGLGGTPPVAARKSSAGGAGAKRAARRQRQERPQGAGNTERHRRGARPDNPNRDGGPAGLAVVWVYTTPEAALRHHIAFGSARASGYAPVRGLSLKQTAAIAPKLRLARFYGEATGSGKFRRRARAMRPGSRSERAARPWRMYAPEGQPSAEGAKRRAEWSSRFWSGFGEKHRSELGERPPRRPSFRHRYRSRLAPLRRLCNNPL